MFLLVRHLLLVAWHLVTVIASCTLTVPGRPFCSTNRRCSTSGESESDTSFHLKVSLETPSLASLATWHQGSGQDSKKEHHSTEQGPTFDIRRSLLMHPCWSLAVPRVRPNSPPQRLHQGPALGGRQHRGGHDLLEDPERRKEPLVTSALAPSSDARSP